MRYLALCCDYDGTLAHHGRVDEATITALERFKESGRRLVMVTGRELDELQAICPRLDLFERVVAENGALLYRPDTGEEKQLGERPPDAFIAALKAKGVERISVGRVIVATWEPHEQTVLETIRDMGLELQVIFNKGAVMILPAGMNKATGLRVALRELDLCEHNAAGIGDAENDHAFLSICECGVAVANALPALKERADIVTRGDHGAGVVELIDEMLANDLAERESKLVRHHVLLGKRPDGVAVRLSPYGMNALVVGTSGGGKSTLTIQGVTFDPAGLGLSSLAKGTDFLDVEAYILVRPTALDLPFRTDNAEQVADVHAIARTHIDVNKVVFGEIISVRLFAAANDAVRGRDRRSLNISAAIHTVGTNDRHRGLLLYDDARVLSKDRNAENTDDGAQNYEAASK